MRLIHRRAGYPSGWLGLLAGIAFALSGHAETTLVKLSPAQLKTAGITIASARAPAAGEAPLTGNSLRLTGRVTVPNRGVAQVSATVTAQVQAVLVNVGEQVRSGSALVRLYSPELLSLQRAYLSASSTAAVSSNRLRRDELLLQDGIIAQSRLDETRSNEQQAQAVLQEQRQLLKLAGMSAAAIGQLTSADRINPVLTVSAPLSGLVLEQSALPGAQVQPGAALFKLGDTRTLWVELQASSSQLNQLQVGNTVSVTGCTQTGKLIAISPQVNRDSQTALVRAEFNHAARCLRPNQYAEVDITTTGSGAVVSIPGTALFRSGGKDYVFVQTREGFKSQEVSVQARQGNDRNRLVWVSNTLTAGTQVATSGLGVLRGAASGLGPEQ